MTNSQRNIVDSYDNNIIDECIDEYSCYQATESDKLEMIISEIRQHGLFVSADMKRYIKSELKRR